jgi:hypothetical protein
VNVLAVMHFARNCHHKTLLSLLLCMALHCPHARPTSFHFSLHSTPSNDLGGKISEIIGGPEYFSFWHGMAWHGMASATWNPWGFQTNVRINFEL